jgi:DNA-binding MarR family transcriptional regulator
MVALINELVDLKLVERVVDPSDRRAFSLTVTDAGRAMLTDCLARIEAHERVMLAGFTDAERATLLDLLGRIERRDPTAG